MYHIHYSVDVYVVKFKINARENEHIVVLGAIFV